MEDINYLTLEYYEDSTRISLFEDLYNFPCLFETDWDTKNIIYTYLIEDLLLKNE